jgi:hypothetical protein
MGLRIVKVTDDAVCKMENTANKKQTLIDISRKEGRDVP